MLSFLDGSLADIKPVESITKPSDDNFEATFSNVKQKEEIVSQTLQCPLPEPSRVHPFCQENVVVSMQHVDLSHKWRLLHGNEV